MSEPTPRDSYYNDDDGQDAVVDVIAPSSKGKQSNLDAYKKFVRDLGMTVHITDSIFRDDADPFYANTDRFRANDLANALTDGSTIVWCALGSKGAARLIPYLEALPEYRKQQIREARKVFIGYSDITALHLYLQAVYGWQTIHGTMLELIANREVDQQSVDALVGLMTGQLNRVEYELLRIDALGDCQLTMLEAEGVQPLSIRSKVVGGNLTMIENTIGTVYHFKGAGKILFLEDIGVQSYALERSLDHLKLAGVLDDVVAIVFGSFQNSEPPELINLVFRRFVATVTFPVFRVNDIGHGFVNNPLPFNTNSTIKQISWPVNGKVSYTLTVDNVYT